MTTTTDARSRPPFSALFARELRALLSLRALWLLLLASAVLTGLAFRTALARYKLGGVDPLEGVTAPTLAALFWSTTAVLPFVITSLAGDDKKSGAVAFLWQLGHRPLSMIIAKALALDIAFMLALLPALTVIGAFALAGGHVDAPALGAAIVGHALYAGVVIGMGLLAVAGTSNPALVTLAGTIALWASHTSTSVLRVFERGLLDGKLAALALVAGVGLCIAAAILLAPAVTAEKKIVRLLVLLFVTAAVVFGALQLRGATSSLDLTEDKRNSLPRAVKSQLATVGDPIRATVRLRADDPRFLELDSDVLSPLSRAAHVEVTLVDVADKSYGLVTYQVGARSGESRSTAREEIVPLVLDLAGVKAQALVSDAVPHPFSGSAPMALALAFGLWPVIAVIGFFKRGR